MKNTVLALMALLFLASCKKNIDELPEATQTGANTFGASINGKPWGPMGFGVVQTAPILAARMMTGNTLIINARNFGSSPKETEMEIYLTNVTEAGIYPLNQNTAAHPSASSNYIYYVERQIMPTNEWITSAKEPGVVTITKLDLANKIVSGTFSFEANSMGLNPVHMVVTDGRFDVKLP
jgi:hypothetical protein